MEDLINLFDSILAIMVSFFPTIFYVIASPEKVVGVDANSLICPPWVTFVASFIIFYVSHFSETKVKHEADLPFLPSKALVSQIFVLVAFGLLVQYLVLLIPSVVPIQPIDAVKTVKALSYPLSVSMTIYGLVFLIYILFPIGSKPDGMTIFEKLDRNLRDGSKELNVKRSVAVENARFFAYASGTLGYICSLYNILRVLFDLNYRQAILPTIILLITSLLLIILFVFIVFDRLPKFFELKSQKKAMPNKGNKGKE